MKTFHIFRERCFYSFGRIFFQIKNDFFALKKRHACNKSSTTNTIIDNQSVDKFICWYQNIFVLKIL